jgi:hypothetical protein
VRRRQRRTRSVHSCCVGCGSEPRNDELAGAETVFMVERNMCNAIMRGVVVPPGSRATSRANGSRRNLGYPASDHRPCADLVRIGKVRTVADDARAWEVGPRHSSCEAGEQSEESPLRRHLRGRSQRCRWSEGRGPRGMRTGKARTGRRARLACQRRWNVYGNLCRHTPEVGAVCGKAARTVLGGGVR